MLYIELIGMTDEESKLLADLFLSFASEVKEGVIRIELNRNEIYSPKTYLPMIRVFSERGNVGLEFVKGIIEVNQNYLKEKGLPMEFDYQLLVPPQHTAS
jgi:hypothetical protein